MVVVVVHLQRGRTQVDGWAPCQPQPHPIGGVEYPRGARPHVRLVLLEPHRLENEPLGGRRIFAFPVVQARPVVDLRGPARLFAGAHVGPHDRVSQGLSGAVEGDKRGRRRVKADARDLSWVDPRTRQSSSGGGDQRPPPLVDVLLHPARMGMNRRHRRVVKSKRPSTIIKKSHSASARAEVDTHVDLGHSVAPHRSTCTCFPSLSSVRMAVNSPGVELMRQAAHGPMHEDARDSGSGCTWLKP